MNLRRLVGWGVLGLASVALVGCHNGLPRRPNRAQPPNNFLGRDHANGSTSQPQPGQPLPPQPLPGQPAPTGALPPAAPPFNASQSRFINPGAPMPGAPKVTNQGPAVMDLQPINPPDNAFAPSGPSSMPPGAANVTTTYPAPLPAGGPDLPPGPTLQ